MVYEYNCPVCNTEHGDYSAYGNTSSKLCDECLIEGIKNISEINTRIKIANDIQLFKESMWKKYGDSTMPTWELTNLIKIVRVNE